MAPAIAAEAAAKLQEGKMFNVVARLVHDVQGNLMVRAAIADYDLHLVTCAHIATFFEFPATLSCNTVGWP
jgi:hypothetical protein